MTHHHLATRQNRTFDQLFSSTRRGARLARYLTLHQLDTWGVPYSSPLADRAALVVAELAANAVLHGRVAGRDFRLRLTMPGAEAALRVEVSDARGGWLPQLPPLPGAGHGNGYGLLLVDSLATAWGVTDRRPAPGKTVWAELDG